MINVVAASTREAIADLIAGCKWKEQKYQKQKSRIFDLTNAICKFAQKRVLIAA